jgi:hypothetical protein
MVKKKVSTGKYVLWILIGAVAGWFAFHFIGVVIGIIGGVYIARKK